MANETTVDITPYVVPAVAKAVLSDSKITFIYGWRDGGKSTSAFNTLIWQCLISPHFRCAHCRAKYNEIAGSTFQTIKDGIALMGLNDYFIITKDRFQIINKLNPNNFFFGASADQPDKIRSTANLTHVVIDEFHDATESDFESLLGTIREKKDIKTNFIAIFNNDKIYFDGWISTRFFKKESTMYSEVERVLVSYKQNPFIDQEATTKKLMMVCFNDEQKFIRLEAGEFVLEQNNDPFFHAFDETRHVGNVELLKGFDVILSFDFNINPATCSVWQFSPGQFVHCIRSYKINNCTLNQLCVRILSDFPMCVFKVTGDPSGHARNTGYNNPNETMYSIIRRELNISYTQVDKPKINYGSPDYWREVRIFCNTVLQYHPNFILSLVNAKDLIRDIQIARPEEGKDKLFKTSGDTEFGMHLADTFMYFLLSYFNDFVKR